MRTAAKWMLGILLTLVALLVVAVIIIYTFDWNRAKPRINTLVSEATGRTFAIEGNLGVDWQRDPLATGGWRRYVPLPVIHAQQLHLGNPEWAEHDDMARVDELSFGIELLPLVRKTVVLRALTIDGADLAIEREADRNNWTFETKESSEPGGEPWKIAVSEVRIRQADLAYRDAPLELSLDASLKSLEDAKERENAKGVPYGMGFTFKGNYRKATLEGSGKTGEALSLRDAEVRFPVLLDARAGKVEARAEGLVGDLYANPTLDLDVRIAAPSMAMLFPLTGIVLPNTPAFETRGHLNGAIDPDNVRWRYADFTGSVGKSDLNGDLTYDATGERPKLTGEMRSKLLRFDDLGPIVGVGGAEADPAAAEAKAQRGQKESNTRPGRVLPNDEFLTDRWRAMDLDLRFTGERIVRDEALPFQRLRTHAIMDDGVLKLQPLAFGVADGEVEADITLDGRRDPMRARLVASVTAVQLPRLFPTVELMKKSAGRIDGAVALSARGNSVAELLGEAGGEVKVYLQTGRISKFLLEAASLNIASAVVAKLFGDSEVNIRCAGFSMALKDGLGTMRDFQISTEDALIDVTGAVDFKGERLALDIKPESTGLRIVSLRTPLYVDGTFADPDIGLEKGPLLLRAGAAAALIAIAPAAAALLPITVPGDNEQPDCGQLLAHARSKPSLNPDTSAPIESPTERTNASANRPDARVGERAAPAAGNDRAAGGGAPTSTLTPR